MKKTPIALTILNWVSLILLGIGLYLSLYFAPMERVMGDVQRIFYFHVSVGWLGMIGFLVGLVAGIVFLITGDMKWDRVEVGGIEIGLTFILVNIVTGMIWARPVWNTWWTWDPRLVTATIMELVYVAYIMLRQGIDNPNRRARFGAIYAIMGFASVPFTFVSIRVWRTIHPVVIGSGDAGAEGAFEMVGDMKVAFFFSLFTFTVIAITFLWHRIRLGKLDEQVEIMKMQLSE